MDSVEVSSSAFKISAVLGLFFAFTVLHIYLITLKNSVNVLSATRNVAATILGTSW